MSFGKDGGWLFTQPSIWSRPQGGSAVGPVTIHHSWFETDVTAAKNKQKKNKDYH